MRVSGSLVLLVLSVQSSLFNSVLNGTENAMRVHSLPVHVHAVENGKSCFLSFLLRTKFG